MSEPNINDINIDDFLKNPPSQQQLEDFLNGDQTEPSWHKFAKGAYSTPLHWWMCHIHFSMLFGLWGEDYQRKAGATQSKLNFILEEALLRYGTNYDVISDVTDIAWKYHRAYLTGRFAGGGFVTYTTIKAMRVKFKLPAKFLIGVTNFGMASFGAGIYLTASGVDSIEELLLGMITGISDKRELRRSLNKLLSPIDDTQVEEHWKDKARRLIEQAESINDIDPVIGDFCSKNATKEEFAEYCQRKGYGIQ